jgi:hypothetical protein
VSSETFGSRYVELPSAQERLDLERAAERRAPFTAVDDALDELVMGALRGQRIIDVTPADTRRLPDAVELKLPVETRTELADHFSVERQQARGAWYVPNTSSLSVGLVHLGHWWQTSRRFTLTLAHAERAAPSFESTDAVAIWAVLEPLFDGLYLPLKLRSVNRLAPKTREQQLPYWRNTIEPLYAALRVGGDAVRQFGPGTGWAELDAEAVMTRRDALISSWAQADIEAAPRLRTHRIGQLVERYYDNATDGRALRRRVMNKNLERTLTAYFGGDWLALLAFLEEEPDPNEEITTAVPAPRLMLGSAKRAATVAAAHGLSPEQVDQMLAAYWRQSEGTSPVELRIKALERFWTEFDAIHAGQTPDMKSLRNLMSGSSTVRQQTYGYAEVADAPAGIEEELLPLSLTEDLQRLWGTKLSRWPERLVSEPRWAWAAALALGPAFTFWHDVGLTAWSICEGPDARTHLEGLEAHYRERWWGLGELDSLGCPVDAELFAELRAAEGKLGPVQQTWREVKPRGSGATLKIGGGTCRDGFEVLRDIVTNHRCAWTERYLDTYLQNRWRSELLDVGNAYNRFAADKAKTPTVKQVVKMARGAATHWCGGDLTGVYAALGLKAPLSAPTYSRVLPRDWRAFMMRVFTELGGEQFDREHTAVAVGVDEVSKQREEYQHHISLAMLAERSLQWVELAEELGRPPELKEFGESTLEYYGKSISEDVNTAWQQYFDAVQRALAAAEAQKAPSPVVPPRVTDVGEAERTADPARYEAALAAARSADTKSAQVVPPSAPSHRH